MLMKRFVFSNFPENGFDIVMFTQKVGKEINKNVEGNSSIFLQILGLGFKQSSISYKKVERKTGKSKWTVAKKIKLLVDSFIAFSYAPIRFVTISGITIFLVGSLWTIYTIVRKLLYDNFEAGWPATLSVLLIGFGVTNISLGIIAEYLWRNFDVSRNRPVFIVDETIEIQNYSNQNTEIKNNDKQD
jgi:polyisoprenyl-phosphate glycosyltransferase